jgi:FKBP-type peptidyl-prolyl cis-trans isomerase
MAKVAHRAFALIMALMFLLTTVAFTGIVVWQIRQDNKANKVETSSDNVDNQGQISNDQGETKLQGTKLADFTPNATPVAELQVTDVKVGDGAEAKADSTITAHYTGALVSDGTVFQSSKDTGQPFTSALSGLIPGWQQGIPGMKVGGIRRLVIPYAQAYGEEGRPDGGIPAKADLVFDIELIEVK